jgi:ubiquinol-cytochrome c reductase cytochrome b subunit
MSLYKFADERLGLTRFTRSTLNKVFPDHWSFMIGEIAMYSFVVLLLTGTYLTFFFDPSTSQVVYHGSYTALRGVPMSAAYESTVHLSMDVRAGLVFRQMHHWAALVFIGAITAHLCRIFFTGAFRRPREINWIIGMTMLLLALGNGFAGYSLPDDLLSGTGLRILNSVVLSVPVVGAWLAFLIFGGEFPSHSIISRLYIIHVLLIPAAIVGLLSLHLAIVWRQKHTQFRGAGRTERNVVGSRLWPAYALKSVGLFALVAGVIAALGGLVQINPVWLYGPYDPAAVSTAAQPDFYLGWVEGALRLGPAWLVHIGHWSISEVFWPGVLLPSVLFAFLFAYPWLERMFTRDRAEHHLLDRPRDHPFRTALGMGVITLFAVLLLSGGQDVYAQHLHISLTTALWTGRILLVTAPIVVLLVTWKICHDLRRAGPPESELEAEPPIASSGADAAEDGTPVSQGVP